MVNYRLQRTLTVVLEESIALKRSVLTSAEVRRTLSDVVEVIVSSLRTSGKVIFFGNGGSAADAQHLAAELLGRFYFDRQALPAIALADNVGAMTAIGNDYSYEETFSRQIRGLAEPGDVAIGLSTSGESENVVRA